MSYKKKVPKNGAAHGLIASNIAASAAAEDVETGSSASASTAAVDENEREVQECIRAITAKTSAIERFGQMVRGGDEQATHELRREVEEIKAITARAQRELTALDPSMSSVTDHTLKNQRRVKHLKLKQNLELALKQFGSASMEALAAAKTLAQEALHARNSSKERGFKPQNSADEENAMHNIEEQMASDELVMAASELQFNDELLAERETDIRGIQRDLEGIKTLYKELAVHVTTQGEDLDNIEANMVQTVANTERAQEQIVIAENYQQRRSKTYGCLLLACAITLIILLIVLTQN